MVFSPATKKTLLVKTQNSGRKLKNYRGLNYPVFSYHLAINFKFSNLGVSRLGNVKMLF